VSEQLLNGTAAQYYAVYDIVPYDRNKKNKGVL